MEETTKEDPQLAAVPSADADDTSESMDSEHHNKEEKASPVDVSREQITTIMEIIAATGKFWHDWDMLKGFLSIRLKQVLAKYPEAQVSDSGGSQQNSLKGETYPELVKRLDAGNLEDRYEMLTKKCPSNALLNFIEGPPFTLQRLCEILLAPKSTYSVLSKLALALEKNLLVTSTLTMSTDPYPGSLRQEQDESDNVNEMPHKNSAAVPNGVAVAQDNGDEEMAEADASEDTTVADTEMQEEKVIEAPANDSDQISDSNPTAEACSANEEPTPPTSQTTE